MICQRCGKCMTPDDMFIVKFEGQFLPIKAKWIACVHCAANLKSDIVYCFPVNVRKAVEIYKYKNRRVCHNGN